MFIKAYEEAVANHQDKLVYICGQDRITYRELDRKARCITAGLLHKGLTLGDRVALRLQSISDFTATCIGVWRAGGVVVPLDPGMVDSEISNLLKISQPSFVVVERANETLPIDFRPLQIEQLKNYQPNEISFARQENDDLLVLFSTGTTGTPKGIVHTHASMSEATRRSVFVSGLKSDDVLLATSLFNTGFGLHSYVLEPIFCGATVVVVHPFHPRIALEIAHKECVSWIQTVPAVLKLLLTVERIPNLPALRTIRLGAATLDEQSRNICVARLGVQPIQGYGMGEVGRIACTTNSPQYTSERMAVNTGIDLKIFGEDQTVVGSEQIGEIGVRTTSLCRSYYLVRDAVQEPIPMHDGYFMTGDLGKLSKDGLLKLLGRIKTFILTPRFKVDPREVEDVLTSIHCFLNCL